MKYQPPFDPAFAGPQNGIHNANADAAYVNGNPATGQAGSIPPAESWEHPMRELVHLISDAGLTPTHSDLQQVRKAVEEIVKRSVLSVGAGAHPLVGYDNATKKFWMKSLSAGSNVTITPVEDPPASGKYRLEIAASTGGGGGGTPIVNIGDGAGISFSGVNGGNNEFRRVKGMNGIVTRVNGNNIEVDGQALLPNGGYNTKVSYPYLGADQTFTVPAGITKIMWKLWGAAGAGPHAEGGPGGYTEFEMTVTPGDVLIVVVGRGGAYISGPNNGYVAQAGPAHYGFGGRCYASMNNTTGHNEGGNGGGLTGVFVTSVSKANARGIAGGGGGYSDSAGTHSQGGSGNDPTNGGGHNNGLYGQDGPDDGTSRGGGGGGYEGGLNDCNRSGGSYNSGEGGKGYVFGSALSSLILHTVEFGNNPPRNADPDYVPGVGAANPASSASTYDGGHGLAVVYY